MKEQMPATNRIFMDDTKYRHLNINRQDALVMDSILRCFEGFSKLTDVLSGEKDVTMSSAIPLLRHIDMLCQIEDADADDDVSTSIKISIKGYLQDRLQNKDLMIYLRIAELLDPRYVELATSQDTVSWVTWLSLQDVRQELITIGIMTHGVNEWEKESSVSRDDSAASLDCIPTGGVLRSLICSKPREDLQILRMSHKKAGRRRSNWDASWMFTPSWAQFVIMWTSSSGGS